MNDSLTTLVISAAGVVNVFRVALGRERAVGFGPPRSDARKPVDWSDDED